jgi:DNA-binding response OmpR family regulator
MKQATLILNVEDNDAARHAKTRLLINAGFRVEEASDGAQALAMVAALQPALVLLDMKLPDVSGWDVCRQIKANPLTAKVFVLQTSAALISLDDKMRGMNSGADDYLSAPFEPNALIAKVRAILAPPPG